MTDSAAVKERFLKDVAEHQMIVLADVPGFRHVRFRKPDTYCMSFELITWPGYLCVAGDMGEYVFQRLEDMFQFFRVDSDGLKINRSYWAEKCQAADRNGGIKEFSKDLFKDRLMDRLKEFCDGDADLFSDLETVIEDDVLRYEDDRNALYRAAMEVEHEGRDVFPDFWEHDCDEYTFHYTWICYAIVWGIGKYDEAKRKA